MRIPDNQLRVRYPKNMTSLYQDEFERKRSCIGGKTAMFNRDKEKKFFKADPISMKTTKQVDFTGEQVPYERVKKNRPASSYGPFISSTSYGHTFQPWGATGYVPTLAPKGNLQSSSNIPFRAVSSYRDTYKGGASGRPGTGVGVTCSGNFAGESGALGAAPGGVQGGAPGGAQGANGEIAAKDQMNVFGGKNRNQKSQISILSSPDKKMPFTKDTTNRVEYRGQKSLERSRPIRHMDNLGNIDLKMDPKFFSTSYRTNYNEFNNNDP